MLADKVALSQLGCPHDDFALNHCGENAKERAPSFFHHIIQAPQVPRVLLLGTQFAHVYLAHVKLVS